MDEIEKTEKERIRKKGRYFVVIDFGRLEDIKEQRRFGRLLKSTDESVQVRSSDGRPLRVLSAFDAKVREEAEGLKKEGARRTAAEAWEREINQTQKRRGPR